MSTGINDGREDSRLLSEEAASRYVVAPEGMIICGRYIPKMYVVVVGTIFIVGLGLGLGLASDSTNNDPHPWNKVSSIIGWLYFNAWAVSFLPQLYLNYIRKSVIGQSFDYVCLNILGFSAYSIYTLAFFAVDKVKADYRERFGNENNVEVNDVVFALWATVFVLVNAAQIFLYERGNQRISTWVIVGSIITLLLFILWSTLLICGVRGAAVFNTLDLLYGISMVKLVVSILKYIPQVYLNFKRKSTVGWNIWNVLLDFSGGSLSVLQQLIDCGTTGNWNGIAGNPIKFCLGSLSMVYDVMFMLQHFCFYRENNKKMHNNAHTNSISKTDGNV